MSILPSVSSGRAFSVTVPTIGHRIFIAVQGATPTSGWSGINLSPHYYTAPPQNGVWDFDLIGHEPAGVVLEVETPFVASGLFSPPGKIKTVRVHAASNSVDIDVAEGAKTKVAMGFASRPGKSGNVIYHQDIASYDDSWGQIGWCSFPLHPKMHKLHHTLTLIIEGPDSAAIQNCVQQAAVAGLIAAIVAAYATGGLALSAAISAFVAQLQSCLGNSFSVRVDDHSEWEEWCV